MSSDDRLDRVLVRLRRQAEVDPQGAGNAADVESRRRRRVLRRRVGLAGSTALVALLAAATAALLVDGEPDRLPADPRAASAPRPPVPSPAAGERRVRALPEADAQVRELAPHRFAVDRGTVWFSVAPGTDRVEVVTPLRTVVVLGTVFAVEVDPAAARPARVGVLVGRVRVEAPGVDPVELVSGEELPPATRRPVPLDPVWRARLSAVFPERVAAERAAEAAPRRAPAEPPVPPGAPPAAPAPAPPGSAPGPAAPDPATPVALDLPETAPQPAATPDPAPSPDPAAPASAGPSRPPSRSGAPERFAAAEARLKAGDAAGAALELERVAEGNAPAADVQAALLDLGRLYRRHLGDLPAARDAYERYLDRFPRGIGRRDARRALCDVLRDLGDAPAERRCAAAYLAEFPHAPDADPIRARLEP